MIELQWVLLSRMLVIIQRVISSNNQKNNANEKVDI